jgi:type VI protein secretion system component VasK
VQAGTRLIIAPDRLQDGTLYADLGTLQADPTSEAGVGYVAEAVALFGPGVQLGDTRPAPDLRVLLVMAMVVALVILLFAIPVRRRRAGGSS